MAKPLNDSALIKTISSSKTPMTADQIATSMKTLRHKVVPLLRGLVSSAQIVEVPATSEFPVRFSYRQTADAAQDQSAGKVVQIASSRRKEEEQPAKEAPAKAAEKPAVKPAARKVGRPSLKSVGDAAKPSKAAEPAITAKKPTEPKAKPSPSKPAAVAASDRTASVKTQAPTESTGTPSRNDQEPMYNRVLRMLGEEPTKREEILMELGPIGLLIDQMTEKGVIESTYLIDSHVFDLTDAGQLELENLPAPVEPVSLAPVEPAPALAPVSEQVDLPPQPLEVVAKAPHGAEEQATLPLPEPVVAEPVAVAPAPVADAIEQPQDPKEQALPENPIMAEMAKLMEKLVTERMGSLNEKIEQGDRDRATLAKVGASIKKATSALQMALDALNEIGDSIS